MENYLSDEILKALRDSGKISNQEVALKVGDLLIAEHVIEKTRRVLNCDVSSLSESKKLLKG
tara:strand:+ start:355 stop:540 length:186 start_codon:yes stop_codon:yes gene_type:complete